MIIEDKFFYDITVIVALNKIDSYTFDALDSIIYQESICHEIVVVANGSNYVEIASVLSQKYSENLNIKILSTPVGQLAFALNLAISSAGSDYIARMDTDDIALCHRLRRQLDFLKKKDLDLVGCHVLLIDENNQELGVRKYPLIKKEIDSIIYRSNPFCHPSVIYKKSIILEARGYNSGFNSEDYDLWLRLKRNEVKWGNVSDVLLKYRIHKDSSQGSLLAYSEVSGLMLREFILLFDFKTFYGFVLSVFKSFWCKLKK